MSLIGTETVRRDEVGGVGAGWVVVVVVVEMLEGVRIVNEDWERETAAY